MKLLLSPIIGVLSFPFLLLHAFVLRLLWHWYAMAAFHLPALTVIQAFGIVLFLHMVVVNRGRAGSCLIWLVCGWLGVLVLR